MRLSVIGAGYVGLVSGACFAELGHSVLCIDNNPAKIDAIRSGQMPIYEPGLDALVARNIAAGRLTFATAIDAAISDSAAVFIAVGTPSRFDGRAELSFVHAAVEACAPFLKPGAVVLSKSTVPIGTGDRVEEILATVRPGLTVSVASNPEFLREGAAISDFMEPDRIVVGVEDDNARAVADAIYAPLTSKGAPILFTRRRTSEMIKYAANSFLATKLGFINEIADLCEHVGADVAEVAVGIGLDSRIGRKFLNAGPGFGGSCFPKDALALLNTANDVGAQMPILERVIHANDLRKRNIGRKILKALGGSVRGATIGVLGLAFKPETDDMREAPSIDIVASLDYWGAAIRAYDPAATEQARPKLPASVVYCDDPYACAEGADAIAIVTEWNEFRTLDLARLKSVMRRPVIVDMRNVLSAADVEAHGFQYDSVGRPGRGRKA